MVKQKSRILTPLLVVFIIMFIFMSTYMVSVSEISDNKQVAIAAESDESSIFDGILDLVLDKGTGLVKDNLPTVGDFLCSEVFDLLGIDYTDSYTKEVKKINSELKNIKKDLQDIISMLNEQNVDAKKRDYRNELDSFFNIVDTFSTTVSPIYSGYNDIMRREKDGQLTGDNATKEEEEFYNDNLASIIFGNGTSTGSLHLQLITFMTKIKEPSRTLNKTLMELYTTTYEYLWAFDTQSFQSKKEFLGYVSTALMQGITLYTFQHLYEVKINAEKSGQLAVLDSRWREFKSVSNGALEYLKKEINTVTEAENISKTTNTATHYATGEKVSTKLYVGRMFSEATEGANDASNYFTYSRVNSNSFVLTTLNNKDFVNSIEEDFKKYKTNYRKDDNFTMAEFLQAAGFSCDDWNNAGLYRGQNTSYTGNAIKSNERWSFSIEYTNMQGKSDAKKYAYAGGYAYKLNRYSAEARIMPVDAVTNKYMAFVSPDGVLMGTYETTFNSYDYKASIILYSKLYIMFNAKSYAENATKLGKVW